ncbi:hypothetical protein DERF_004670 [Dermatophagoides farinae]|uniref:Uncharacterized protein n=1 Tax=Dermatophagoides farinae TaxID=6954 RepID=A0A922I5A3_DERFA|nr:hypothetical protein DERF_004670 [Dermatophagoides farinae]
MRMNENSSWSNKASIVNEQYATLSTVVMDNRWRHPYHHHQGRRHKKHFNDDRWRFAGLFD